MKNIKYLLVMLILLTSTGKLFSQQTPLFSQYTVNKFLLNPAVAGGNGITDVSLMLRDQYTGFTNSPRTFALTAQSRVLNDSYIMKKLRIRKDQKNATRFTNVGMGGGIFSDRNGIMSKTGFRGTYAYHINFNNRFQLSMGLSASFFQYRIDDADAFIAQSGDPVLLGNKKQFWVPDASFGAYITNNQIYAGLTITDALGSSISLGNDPLKDNFSTLRNYMIVGGYNMNINENFKLEPSFLLRATSNSQQLDLNAKIHYLNNYWLGLSYRTNNTFVTMVGMNVEYFRFGYAFDANFGDLRTYSGGSHEFIIGVRFGENSTKRFRWLKKDEMEFDM